MLWRILLVLLKSALMVALFELVSPVAEAIGLRLAFVGPVAEALSRAAAIPYREAKTLFLLVLATTLLRIPKIVWDLITGSVRLPN